MIRQVNAINELLQERRGAAASGLEIPPRCFQEMGGEFLRFDESQRQLVVRFPVEPRYQNPTGAMQGGFIAAAIDNTMGPLCYLVAPPSVTLAMNLAYVRPVLPEVATIEVTATVVEATRRQLHVAAEVRLPDGKTAARATALFGISLSDLPTRALES